MNDRQDRYSRQARFGPIGERGQRQIESSRVLVCGCGALGSVIAERLARAGVGHIRIVDRDWVEYSNLQRQTLFEERHATEATPKAVAAAETIGRINSEIRVEAIVEDLDYRSIESLAADCDLLLDGTDNFETRFVINDLAVSRHIPWIHAGCLGAGGQILSILPGETACFRCLVSDLPPRDAMDTCDSAGVLGSAIGLIASWQSGEALKILSGNRAQVCHGLVVVDCWNNELRIMNLGRSPDCPACGKREFPFLSGQNRSTTTVLCGKNAVQIESPQARGESLESIQAKFSKQGHTTSRNAFFLRATLAKHTLTVFPGGRTVIEGTTSESEAKTILSRVLGS